MISRFVHRSRTGATASASVRIEALADMVSLARIFVMKCRSLIEITVLRRVYNHLRIEGRPWMITLLYPRHKKLRSLGVPFVKVLEILRTFFWYVDYRSHSRCDCNLHQKNPQVDDISFVLL